jgi:hypothetical protein
MGLSSHFCLKKRMEIACSLLLGRVLLRAMPRGLIQVMRRMRCLP